MGVIIAAIIDPNDIILVIKKIIRTHDTIIIAGASLKKIFAPEKGNTHVAMIMPPTVDTPLPPLNFRKTGKTCPIKTETDVSIYKI